MVVAIDFDGTVVSWKYPKVGEDIGAVPVLKDLVEAGHKIILCTMRDGQPLEEAKKWFEDNDIPLWAINRNPSQWTWSKSKKIHANLYIDDQALGAPLIYPGGGERPYLDWLKVRELLVNLGYVKGDS